MGLPKSCSRGEGELVAYGVRPSVFSALNVIEFTWLLNRRPLRIGTPAAFDPPAALAVHSGTI